MRPFYFLLGWCAFSLGAVGALVPGLPTVPLMLVALWAFSKSSDRFHQWLYSHRIFGPPLQQWHQHRVIPLRAKVLSVIMMAASLTYMAFFTDVSPTLLAVTALVMLGGAAYILRQRSAVPLETTDGESIGPGT